MKKDMKKVDEIIGLLNDIGKEGNYIKALLLLRQLGGGEKSELEKLLREFGIRHLNDVEHEALNYAKSHIGDLITTDCFKDPNLSGKDYREKAVERILELRGIRVSSNTNILQEMFEKVFVPICPDCGTKMKFHGGGGNFEVTTSNYRCGRCNREVSITLAAEAISTKKGEEKKS